MERREVLCALAFHNITRGSPNIALGSPNVALDSPNVALGFPKQIKSLCRGRCTPLGAGVPLPDMRFAGREFYF